MTYASEVLADSPSGYWELDETSGTTAEDISGNGRDGTYTNFSSVGSAGGIAGTSASSVFDATNDLVEGMSPSSAFADSVFTIEAWIKPASIGGGVQGIMHCSDSGGWTKYLRLNAGVLEFGWRSGGVEKKISGSTLSAGTWYHVAGSTDGSGNGKLYLNGSIDNTGSPGGAPETAAKSLRFGGGWADTSTNWPFDGQIAHGAYYPSQLTDARISAHYLAGTSRYDTHAATILGINPELWLDAADDDVVTVSSGRVSAWADKSGKDYDASSPSGIYDAYRETASINSLDTVRFQSSTPTIMNIGNTTDLHLSNDFSIFVVVKFTSVSKGASKQNTIITNDSLRYELAEYQSNTGGYINGSGMATGSVSLSATTPYIFELHRDGSGNYTKLVNGNSDATGTITGMASGNQLYLGWRSGGSTDTGGDLEIAELVINNSELSSGDKTTIRSALGSKWGISVGGSPISATLSGSGSLAGTWSAGAYGTAALSGSGDVSATWSAGAYITSGLSGSGSLSGSFQLGGLLAGLAGVGALTADLSATFALSVSLTGSGSLSGSLGAEAIGDLIRWGKVSSPWARRGGDVATTISNTDAASLWVAEPPEAASK